LSKAARLKAVDSLWARLRDGFSAQALELTSPSTPTMLDGGLPLTARAFVTVVSMAIAAGLAALAGGPFGIVFLFPGLAIAGVFGGGVLALASLAATVIAVNLLFPSPHTLLLDIGAALQVAVALVGRAAFRESRRWGVRYRRLISAISSATAISDPEGRVERPNPELGKLIGMDWPAYANLGWLEAVHPDDALAMAAPRTVGQPYQADIRFKNPSSGDWHWFELRAVPLLGEDGKVVEWISSLSDIHQSKLAQEHQKIVIGEARHRLKNLITIIESLAKSSKPKDDQAVDEFMRKFSGRLHALSAASDLALASNYSVIDTEEIVRATLGPFLETGRTRVAFGGPKLALSEVTGGQLALGVHELATNAIKYGALSVPDGRVSFTWRTESASEGETVVMEWVEDGRPDVVPPQREGFGGRLIKFIPSREKSGKVDIEYRPGGYYCRVSFWRARSAAE
jgi:PAS domain S-box-containing protein